MKITKITLHNYRAFYGTHSIDLSEDGKNLLLYGENGSGKSSLYKGLDTFFTAASLYSNDKAKWEHNIFVPTDEEKENVFIELQVDRIDTPIVLSKPDEKLQGENAQFVRDANKIRGFLDYRRLLKTHLNAENTQVNLFDILVNEILFHSQNRFFDGWTLDTLYNYFDVPEQDESKTFAFFYEWIYSRVHDERQGVHVVNWIKEAISQFNEGFKLLLTEILQDTQTFLSYFVGNRNLEISFDFQGLNYIGRRQIEGNEVFLTVKLNGEKIPHQEFLNEARLSALSISLYLAAIKNNPSETNPFKLLFLDDIFIGLDMSNRLPLLAILREHFDDYQVIMTTYDRNWYEVAKDYLGDDWQKVEMYVGNNGICEIPVILQEHLEPIEKAKKYFDAHDYFSAGNNLRKTVEKRLEKLIPETYRLTSKDLNDLISRLFTYYDDCNCSDLIPAPLREKLRLYKDIVFNPASHYDLRSPLYKAEIEKAFEIVAILEGLPILERKLLIGMKGSLFYKNEDKNYEATYVLLENIYAIIIPNQTTRITDAKHILHSFKHDGENKAGNITEMKLSKRAEKIQHYLKLTDLPDWQAFIDIHGKALNEMI